MALLNLFGKKRNDPKKPRVREDVSAVESSPVSMAPSVPAPSSPILKQFHVSEKSTRGMALGQYTFLVTPRATKSQVRDAVKRAYHVDVVGVNIVRLPAKERRLGRHVGAVPARKKAIVTLKQGQVIAAAQQ